MERSATKLTYRDYLLLPDDGKRYEILDGELYMTPSPVTRHQLISMRFSHALMIYLDHHPIGVLFAAPCDVILSDTDVVEPDLLFVKKGGAAQVTEKNIQGPPDLVVEILSPGTAARDRELKRKRYEYFGVQEYWLIDPDQNTVEVLRLEGGQFCQVSFLSRSDSLTSPLFPGLTLALDSLMR